MTGKKWAACPQLHSCIVLISRVSCFVVWRGIPNMVKWLFSHIGNINLTVRSWRAAWLLQFVCVLTAAVFWLNSSQNWKMHLKCPESLAVPKLCVIHHASLCSCSPRFALAQQRIHDKCRERLSLKFQVVSGFQVNVTVRVGVHKHFLWVNECQGSFPKYGNAEGPYFRVHICAKWYGTNPRWAISH